MIPTFAGYDPAMNLKSDLVSFNESLHIKGINKHLSAARKANNGNITAPDSFTH
jgi:hypothetical protein